MRATGALLLMACAVPLALLGEEAVPLPAPQPDPEAAAEPLAEGVVEAAVEEAAVAGAGLAALLPMADIGKDTAAAQKAQPGRAAPAAQAEPAAYRFMWDDNSSLVVIGEGLGLTRPAWVVTWNRASDQMLVYYRALAYRDAQGAVHIDARGAQVLGPHRDRWSPDSFAVVGGMVHSMDDEAEHGTHSAPLSLVVKALVNPPLYRRLLAQAQGIVGENL